MRHSSLAGTTRAGLALALAAACVATPRAGQQVSLTALITAYADGRHDEVVAQAAAIEDLGPLRLRFVQEVPAWIASDPALAARRRAASAALLLELAHARLETDWGRLTDLVEFTCAGLRAAGTASPFELAWHRASIALAGRARMRLWLLGEYAQLPHQPPRRVVSKNPPPYPKHLIHALERFPDDSQLRLAQILAWTWGRDAEPVRNVERRDMPLTRLRTPPQAEAVVALEPLVDDSEVGSEALVRIGHLQFTMGRHDAAFDALSRAQQREAGAAIRYLSFFSAGRVLEAQGRADEAMAQYAKALEIVPDAESATVALGSLQFVSGDREAAIARLNRVFDRTPAAADPGRLTGYGSFIHWPELRRAMRAAVPQ
jgi:tetratricopeptide (TPR) repeat protein